MSARSSIVPAERIESRIHVFRGQKVMTDSDLAVLYQVNVKALNQAVRRNRERFPEDFMFQLTQEEFASLRSQTVTSRNSGRGGRRYRPLVFTEQGVGMLSSVLRSPRAVQINIAIIRTFVELRRLAITHEELRRRLDLFEQKTDRRFRAVIDAIRKLMEPDDKHKPTRGFAR